jgi:hypothetical protein
MDLPVEESRAFWPAVKLKQVVEGLGRERRLAYSGGANPSSTFATSVRLVPDFYRPFGAIGKNSQQVQR